MATLTATVQDEYPPRVLLTATGLADFPYTLVRVVGGRRTLVRGAEVFDVYPTTAFVAVDAELPYGVPVTWRLEIAYTNTLADDAGPLTVTLPGGKLVLSDAISGLSAEVVLFAHDELVRPTKSTVYNIDGENVIVSSPLGQPTATYEYYTETLTARDQLATLLATCTSGIYQQRGPSPAYDADDYLAVLSSRERRFSQDGSDERRITAVQAASCTGWSYGQENRGYTYQDVANTYTGLTYADVAADYATYLAVAQGDFG